MSDVQLPTSLGRVPPAVTAWTAGAAVAGVVLEMLLHPTLGLYVVEGVALIAALATVGLVLFTDVVPRDIPIRRWLQRPIVQIATIGYAAVLLTLPFDVMTLADKGLRGLGDTLSRSVVLHSGQFDNALARGLGLVLVVVGIQSTRRAGPWVSRAGTLLVVVSFATIGHARTYSPQAAVVAAVIAHVASAAAWFGGLIGLGIALRQSRADAKVGGRLLATFARVMEVALALLLAAGVGLAVLYLPDPGALVHTAYGQVLLVKLAVLVGVLVLSTANHFRLIEPARRGSAAAIRVLRANIAAEQVGILAILAITSVLMRQDPLG